MDGGVKIFESVSADHYRKKLMTEFPDLDDSLAEPNIYYPGCNDDTDLIEMYLKKYPNRPATFMYQDPQLALGKKTRKGDESRILLNEKFDKLNPGHLELITMGTPGREHCACEPRADVTHYKMMYVFMLSDGFTEKTLSNSDLGSIVCGYQTEIDLLQMFYTGWDKVNDNTLRKGPLFETEEFKILKAIEFGEKCYPDKDCDDHFKLCMVKLLLDDWTGEGTPDSWYDELDRHCSCRDKKFAKHYVDIVDKPETPDRVKAVLKKYV